jgi:hypothetical protein
MEKYYTPELEEFHVGFEYEELDPDYQGQSDGKQWKPIKLSKEGLISIATNWKYFQEYRVKTLDREDIESLGFEHYNGLIYRKAGTPYELIINFKRKVKDSITIRELIGDKWFELVVFPARNKSELKKILKQIGI